MNKCITDEYGTKRWYSWKTLHREDGPAIEYADGTKMWSRYGLLHRDDGPAIVHSGDKKAWWLNGKQYTQEEFRLLQFTKGIKINECM